MKKSYENILDNSKVSLCFIYNSLQMNKLNLNNMRIKFKRSLSRNQAHNPSKSHHEKQNLTIDLSVYENGSFARPESYTMNQFNLMPEMSNKQIKDSIYSSLERLNPLPNIS